MASSNSTKTLTSLTLNSIKPGEQISDAGEAGKAMKINGPTRKKGTGDHQRTERTFIDWYCKQCEDVTPTHEEMRNWKLKHADVVSDRTFGTWKATARQEFANPKSIYQMFKDLG